MNLIFLGAPGAGKGTMAEVFNQRYGIPTISTGNILRAALNAGTEMGLKAKSYMDTGALVPDEVIIGIVKERLQAEDCKLGFILDGVPRTIAQAEAIENMGIRIDAVVELEVGDDVIMRRMSGRRVCPKCGATYHLTNKKPKVEGICDYCGSELIIRKDDEPATVLERLKAYHDVTEPLVGFYAERKKLVQAPCHDDIQENADFIQNALEEHQAMEAHLK